MAATFRGGEGLRVWAKKGNGFRDWKLVVHDNNYGKKDIYAAAFSNSGVLYTAGYDGRLRRYEAEFKFKPLIQRTRNGTLPYSVALSPAGDKLAVGYTNSSAVDVFDAKSLKFSYAPSVQGVVGYLNAVAWSRDGRRLFAAGNFESQKKYVIRSWEEDGTGAIRDFESAPDAVFHAMPCAEKIVLAAGSSFGILSVDGEQQRWQPRVQADLRGSLGDNFTVSEDGTRVRFGFREFGGSPVLFDLNQEAIVEAPEKSADLSEPKISGLPIVGWQNSTSPRIATTDLELQPQERAQSLAIEKNGKFFALGSDFFLYLYDHEGNLKWKRQAPGAVWGVNIPSNRDVVVVACGDGTIRWYNLEDGEELLALFVHADQRWIAWTPKGYYTASARGESLIGWHVNRKWDQSADFFAISRFRDTYYRPDIVTRVLAALSVDKAILLAQASLKQPLPKETVLDRKPPVVRILSPLNLSSITADEVTVTYTLRSPSGDAVKNVMALVDGSRVAADTSFDRPLPADVEQVGSIKIKVPDRDIKVSIVAQIGDAVGEAATVKLFRLSAINHQDKPNLFALIVGVDDYDDKALTLKFPGKDADDIATQIRTQVGKAFGDVTVRQLKNREPGKEATYDNFRKGLSWLRQKAEAPEDVALVFFAGHGKSIPGAGSYLLPVDYDGNQDLTAIEKRWLFSTLRQVNGRLVIMVDACHGAGGLNTVDFVNDAAGWDATRVVAFASSARAKSSYGKDGNGLFTRAILEGLGGAAPHVTNVIHTDELQVYLRQRVKKLAAPERQNPIMSYSPSWDHMPIAILP